MLKQFADGMQLREQHPQSKCRVPLGDQGVALYSLPE